MARPSDCDWDAVDGCIAVCTPAEKGVEALDDSDHWGKMEIDPARLRDTVGVELADGVLELADGVLAPEGLEEPARATAAPVEFARGRAASESAGAAAGAVGAAGGTVREGPDAEAGAPEGAEGPAADAAGAAAAGAAEEEDDAA